MVRKLEYERALCQSNDREYLSGHLVNFAMTAYHLIEWTWEDLNHHPATKTRMAEKLGSTPDQFSKSVLFEHVMQACPGMYICQAIANGTKHVQYDGTRSGKVVETFVSASPSLGSLTTKAIVDDVESGDVRVIFDQVLQWWIEFIYSHNIDRYNGPYSGG